MPNIVVKRGEIFYANLSPVIGLEQGDIAPVIIIQNDIGNRYAPTVVVAVITSQINKAKLPTHVEISSSKYGLIPDSVVLLEQIRTIDKRRLERKIGNIDIEDIIKINKALAIELDIDCYRPSNVIKKDEIEKYYTYTLGNVVQYLEEDLEHEFKEVKGTNPVDSIKQNVGEYITSFLNGSGGTIYYGISDDKIVKGIELDSKQKDYIRRDINNSIASIRPNISPDCVKIKFESVYGSRNEKLKNRYVVEVYTKPRLKEKEIYIYKNEIHLRGNGIKKKLQGYELVDFIRRKTIEDYINS